MFMKNSYYLQNIFTYTDRWLVNRKQSNTAIRIAVINLSFKHHIIIYYYGSTYHSFRISH